MKPLLLTLLTALGLLATATAAEKPNIVLIFADDLGYGDLGCYGATKLKTPRIDSLATDGRKFTDAHSASAVCSPSRYGLLTGSYPLRKNFWGPTPTWSQELTIEWLKQQDPDQPFFLYLATTHIHHPFTPAEQFIGTSECGLYGDFVHELDWMVGGVLDALEEMGVAENTLVIFTSDNGGMLNVTGQKAWQAGHRINGDLQGFKFGAWEGGHRVPFIARWPGKIPPGTTSDQLLNLVDLVATMAAITGRELAEGEGIDSINQLESLTGDPAKPVRETMVITPNSPKHLSLRKGKWVYIPAQGAGGFQGQNPGDHLFSDAAALPFTKSSHSDYAENGRIVPDAPPAQLYDLEADPGQENNIHAEHPALVKELEEQLARYRAAIPDTQPIGWINLEQ